jgi:molybdopterin-containing oxidoreductase family iron-sulfur binding subunit
MNRRTFLKIAGMGSLSFAAGCLSEPEKNLFSLVQAPDDMVTGKATWYATTCRECPAGCGVLAKNREGRVVKLEGNPLHPINKGSLCPRGQAALQGVYNPDRIAMPLVKEGARWKAISFQQAESLLHKKIEETARQGPNRVRLMSEVVGMPLLTLFEKSLHKWQSEGVILFEPLAYESLKSANQMIFGMEGLVSYRMDDADFLVSFGADFLETWLSPVMYARQFKTMHAFKGGIKEGRFVHISPYQSLTAANADLWLSCRPGGEAAVALGLIREVLLKRVGRLPEDRAGFLKALTAPYTEERVIQASGVSRVSYVALKHRLVKAERALVLGTGSGASVPNALQTNLAANLLNLLLDPGLRRLDFNARHRVEIASRRSHVFSFLGDLEKNPEGVLLLNNVNPAFNTSQTLSLERTLKASSLFVASFSNFMDETSSCADLIIPVGLPLECWDVYGGMRGMVGSLQPAMGGLTGAPDLGDLILRLAFDQRGASYNYRTYLYASLVEAGIIKNDGDWMWTIQKGGIYEGLSRSTAFLPVIPDELKAIMEDLKEPVSSGYALVAVPSIRFFDGRGANRPWLCEVPDSLSQVSWQTPVATHPDDMTKQGLRNGDIIGIQSEWGKIEAPVIQSTGVRPGSLAMPLGQGHDSYGRYAKDMGVNPQKLLSPNTEAVSGAPSLSLDSVTLSLTGRSVKLARMSGSRFQQGRKIALSAKEETLHRREPYPSQRHGLAMWDFPMTLPLPEGYDRQRDIYPPHPHEDYRWAMVVDLDRCIGCGACAVACYAENNVGVVGMERVVEEREMSWLMIQRYHDPENMERITFLPMFCQHCDNAPCESVCPVYAPHHSKEGLNNQIYNRCIGTRFCSQNCPYKVRRFNWFTWKWPGFLHLQLNPDVTVRSKGVMEKCSFCIQRIKEAHGKAKDEDRKIRDGEVQPACLQTCPTGVFTFGNLMDQGSKVRQMVEDRRAYQVMGYLNTKPAVIYLKKVIQEI